jgi:hypothetical protein
MLTIIWLDAKAQSLMLDPGFWMLDFWQQLLILQGNSCLFVCL